MFIKQAYEDRLKKENEDITASLTQQHQKAQPKIGSIKNTRLNYDKDEHFFSKDDVPVNAQQIVNQVKEETDPDFLGLRKRQWNTSVFVPKNPLAEETFERKMIKIEMQEHKLIILNRLENQKKSLLCFIILIIYIRTKRVMSLTKRKQAELITSYINNSLKFIQKDYKSGIDRQNELIYKLREEKHNEKEIRDQIKKEYQFMNPSASSQKIDAAVFRIAYEKKNLKQVDDDIEFGTKQPFYPNLSKTLKHKITNKYYHNGVWQTFYSQPKIKLDPIYSQKNTEENSKDYQDGKTYEAWSCCMNQDRNSEGCCRVKKDAKKWNYESIKHY